MKGAVNMNDELRKKARALLEELKAVYAELCVVRESVECDSIVNILETEELAEATGLVGDAIDHLKGAVL